MSQGQDVVEMRDLEAQVQESPQSQDGDLRRISRQNQSSSSTLASISETIGGTIGSIFRCASTLLDRSPTLVTLSSNGQLGIGIAANQARHSINLNPLKVDCVLSDTTTMVAKTIALKKEYEFLFYLDVAQPSMAILADNKSRRIDSCSVSKGTGQKVTLNIKYKNFPKSGSKTYLLILLPDVIETNYAKYPHQVAWINASFDGKDGQVSLTLEKLTLRYKGYEFDLYEVFGQDNENYGKVMCERIKSTQSLDEDTMMMVEEDNGQCVICLNNPKDTLLLPCRHMCICEKCSGSLLSNSNRNCPLCRADYATMITLKPENDTIDLEKGESNDKFLEKQPPIDPNSSTNLLEPNKNVPTQLS